MLANTERHYRRPGWFTRNVFNRLVRWSTRLGVSIMGSRVLETTGRRSGEPRHTPVNLLSFDGQQFLVSPRGHGDWVRNVRAADGRLALLLGRRRSEYLGRELDPTDPLAVPVLREYLRRWKAEVGVFFDGASANSTDEELVAIAPRHPIFELTPA